MKKNYLQLALTVSAAVLFTTNAFAVTLVGTPGNGWQAWSGVTLNGNGWYDYQAPYWNNASFEGTANGIGYYMSANVAGQGVFNAAAGSVPNNTYNGPGAPGLNYNYWGPSTPAAIATSQLGPANGASFDPSFTFSGVSSATAVFKNEYSNQDGQHTGIPGNVFGWYSVVNGAPVLHPLIDAGSVNPGASASFNPTAVFGFYLIGQRGNFFTQDGFDTAEAGFTSWPNYQHFTVFQQDANTLWFGIEDLITSMDNGVGGMGDSDFNDMIIQVQFTPQNTPDGGSTLLLLGASLMALMGVARMKVNSLLKK